MDLDDPHHVQVDVHLKYAGKSEKGAKYKVETLNESQTIIYNSNNLLILHTNIFVDPLDSCSSMNSVLQIFPN